jgi:hypothetical protein
VLPAGHAGSHRYALAPDPTVSPLATRSKAWRRSKTCPECGERIPLLARACSVCGNRFDRPAASHGREWSEPGTSQAAVIAMACSLVGIWVVSIPLGLYARRAVERSSGRLAGRGLATIAVVLGTFDMIATGVVMAVLL